MCACYPHRSLRGYETDYCPDCYQLLCLAVQLGENLEDVLEQFQYSDDCITPGCMNFPGQVYGSGAYSRPLASYRDPYAMEYRSPWSSGIGPLGAFSGYGRG